MMYRPVILIIVSVSSVLCQISQFQSCPRACLEAPFPGTCRALLPRYYFNPLTGSCDCFIFGGCQSGSNNFQVLAHCMQTCGVHPSTQFTSAACNQLFPTRKQQIPGKNNAANLITSGNRSPAVVDKQKLTPAQIDKLKGMFDKTKEQHIAGLDNTATHRVTTTPPSLTNENIDRLKEIFNQTSQQHIQGLDNTASHKIPPIDELPITTPTPGSDERQKVTSRPGLTSAGRPLPPSQLPVTKIPTTTTTPRPTTTFAQRVQEKQRQQLEETIRLQEQRQAIQRQVQQDQLEDQRKTQQQLLEQHFGSGVRSVKKATLIKRS